MISSACNSKEKRYLQNRHTDVFEMNITQSILSSVQEAGHNAGQVLSLGHSRVRVMFDVESIEAVDSLEHRSIDVFVVAIANTL